MSAKHTPGPWVGARADECWHVEGEDGYRVAHVIDANSWPQNEANARLIVAAPCLLDALLIARERFLPGEPDREHIDAAIAKATGEA